MFSYIDLTKPISQLVRLTKKERKEAAQWIIMRRKFRYEQKPFSLADARALVFYRLA